MINKGENLDFFNTDNTVFYKGIGFLNLSASATPHSKVLDFAWSATASNYIPLTN